MYGRRVEDSTIDQTAFVVHLYLLILQGHLTVTLYQYLILQTAGQYDDTILLGILLQELLTCFTVGTVELLLFSQLISNALLSEQLLSGIVCKYGRRL